MAYTWDSEEDAMLIRLLKEGCTYAETAKRMNEHYSSGSKDKEPYTKGAVRGRARRLGVSSFVGAKQDIRGLPDGFGNNFDEGWEMFCDFIGKKDKTIDDKLPLLPSNEILVLSDIHAPFYNKKFLKRVVEKHKNEIGTVVVCGDFMDTGAFSPHFREVETDVISDLVESKLIAQYLAESFDNVIYVHGTHENWYNKAKKKLPKEFQALLKDRLLEYVLADLPNSYSTSKFYTQIGDCVFGHPSMFRQRRGSDVFESFKYFASWQKRLGLNEINCYVHAHTHRLGAFIIEYDGKKRKLFEGGAFCEPSQHLISGQQVRYDPPSEGYVIICQDVGGRTDLNASREYTIEYESDIEMIVQPII